MGEGKGVKISIIMLLAAAACATMAYAVTPDEIGVIPTAIVDEIRRQNNATIRDLRTFRSSAAVVMIDANGRKALDSAIAFFERNRNLGPADIARFMNELSALSDGERVPDWSAAEEFAWQSAPPVELERGDVVCARSENLWSRHLASASHDKRFSHIAVVLNGGDNPILVETGGSLDDETRFERKSWREFCVDAADCAVYRFEGDSAVCARIGDEAEKRVGIPFDAAFDLKTKNRLYCAEMVHDAVNAAVGRKVIGTSRKGDFEYVAIDDCYRSGFVKVFDAKEWRPPPSAEKTATATRATLSSAGTRIRGKSSAASTNRASRIRIIPMHGRR